MASRYFCTTCDLRCYPWDGFEALTTMAGDNGPVLLRSANAKIVTRDRENPKLWAYCWKCEQWRECYRLTDFDIARMYARRKNATGRFVSRGVSDRANAILEARTRAKPPT